MNKADHVLVKRNNLSGDPNLGAFRNVKGEI